MKKICVVTTTRAEYGLLKNVIREIISDRELQLCLIVTGTHLSPEFGMTVKEIEADGFPINGKINILLDSDSASGVSKSMGIAFISFADLFDRENPDILIVLGDRYELIPICACAVNAKIPIAHISGGETTEGAVDECFRHCVTKMSYLHFPGHEEYRQRIIQLGEEPGRVFNVGDLGIENVLKTELLSKEELEKSINFKLDMPYASVTFHPETLNNMDAKEQCMELLKAIRSVDDMKFVFTKANADTGGRVINECIDKFVLENPDRYAAFTSLGQRRYLSLIKYSEFVMGNSSSGIVEAPCFGVPTINIGDRQKGRLKPKSVLDCDCDSHKILAAIETARSRQFKNLLAKNNELFKSENTAAEIVKIIKDVVYSGNINLKKRFFDLGRSFL